MYVITSGTLCPGWGVRRLRHPWGPIPLGPLPLELPSQAKEEIHLSAALTARRPNAKPRVASPEFPRSPTGGRPIEVHLYTFSLL